MSNFRKTCRSFRKICDNPQSSWVTARCFKHKTAKEQGWKIWKSNVCPRVEISGAIFIIPQIRHYNKWLNARILPILPFFISLTICSRDWHKFTCLKKNHDKELEVQSCLSEINSFNSNILFELSSFVLQRTQLSHPKCGNFHQDFQISDPPRYVTSAYQNAS